MRHFWAIVFGVVLAAAFILTAVSPAMGWWLPPGVSSYSKDIDILYYGILIVTAFFFVLTEAILVYNMFRWVADPARKAEFVHGHHRLEMLWTVVPGIILFLLAVLQINVWADIKYPSHMSKMVEEDPSGVLPMEVTTRQWEFRMRYPSPEHLAEWADKSRKTTTVKEYQARLPERRDDVFDVNNVHTWKGVRTVVFLRTRDVGHAFFVPVLRVKQDSMPGRTIPLWFEATESNTEKVPDRDEWRSRRTDGKVDPAFDWDLVCTQYCGSRHSMMRGKVFVHPTRDDFLAWLRTQQKEYQPPTGAAAQ
jgi:cytochrome c oxidase subunit 2